MYCYHCGKKIKNLMQKCPYCEMEIETSQIRRVVLENTWDEIAKQCPSLSESNSKSFSIEDHLIVISDETYIFAHINAFVNQLRNRVIDDIKNYYDYWSFDALVRNGEAFIREKFLNVGHAVLGFKYKNSGRIADDDKATLLALMNRAEFAWTPIYTVASEFDDLKDALSERRATMGGERRGYWVGGGFGFSGAIKGKIKADILNAGASAVNSVGNLARRSIQAGIDRSNINKLKHEIKNSEELKNAVFDEVEQFFKDWKHFLSTAFLPNYSPKKYDNTMRPILDDEPLLPVDEAINLLTDNPFHILAYASVYYAKPHLGTVLTEMACFCGIETHLLPRLQEVDALHFHAGSLNLPSIGFDTEETDLRQIKERLISLEKRNPIYTTTLGELRNQDTIVEQRYHRKVDELLALRHIETAKKEVADILDTHTFSDAIQILAKKEDYAIQNLLFYKMMYHLKETGSRALIAELGGNIPSLVADALTIYWHKKDASKHEDTLRTIVQMGHPFPTAYYGEYLYLHKEKAKKEAIGHLIYAAQKNCALAMRYIGMFYKNGSDGKYRDVETAKSYLSVAAALGEHAAKDALNK